MSLFLIPNCNSDFAAVLIFWLFVAEHGYKDLLRGIVDLWFRRFAYLGLID